MVRPLLPRKPMSTEPFSERQRCEIQERYYYLRQSVQKIAQHFHVGHEPVENVLRWGYFRVAGRRRTDRNERTAA